MRRGCIAPMLFRIGCSPSSSHSTKTLRAKRAESSQRMHPQPNDKKTHVVPRRMPRTNGSLRLLLFLRLRTGTSSPETPAAQSTAISSLHRAGNAPGFRRGSGVGLGRGIVIRLGLLGRMGLWWVNWEGCRKPDGLRLLVMRCGSDSKTSAEVQSVRGRFLRLQGLQRVPILRVWRCS